jgi:TolB-like protein/class 3 adenylate cyclase
MRRSEGRAMSETRRIAAILIADVAGYSRLAGVDEEGTLSRLRGLRGDLIDPTIAVHKGRVVKRTGDGSLIEFRSVVDAVRCAVEIQNAMVERNAGVPADRRIEFRVGIHLGDVVEEADGDLMGDGVNIAARLEGVCEPGSVCLSEQAYWQVKGRLELAVTDLGPIELKNIAEPIRVYSLDVGRPAVAKPALAPASEKSAPPRLSIVVLPFANIGGHPEQEHFVDGITESLTTDLSRIRRAYVVARNTAFTYKGKPLDVKTIGRELNVRYILEGSVQRGGNRMRVNVQLIDAEAGNHLWAERFDKPLADLFDMQDEIVARLAGALNAHLIAAEARRAERAPNPDSMDLYFQGLAWFNKGWTPANITQARSFFDRALAADPDNVDALVGSARVDELEGALSFVSNPLAAFAAAEVKLTKALSSVPDHPHGHLVLGLVEIFTGRAAEGIAECEHALQIDRNLAHAHYAIGIGHSFVGRAEETEAHIGQALRLSPRDPMAYTWMYFAGAAKLQLGIWAEAAAWFRRSIEANRNYPHPHFGLAAALAQLGRLDEAHSAVKAGLAVTPTFAVSRARAAWTAVSDDPTYLAQLEPILEGLRKAGVPEQ